MISKKKHIYKIIYSNDEPSFIKKYTVYVIGDNNFFWVAILECPCGCRDILYLNLLREANPRWRVFGDEEGVVSIVPSVRRTVGCKSHFTIRRGHMRWAYF